MDTGLDLAIGIAAASAAACWLASVVTREYSWTDRLWSVLPPVYAWVFAAAAGFPPRSVVMAALASAWGLRLTFNFWRKGGFAPGGEDYRWAILRAKLPPAAWAVFNVVFVAGYQHALILAFTLPAWRTAATATGPLGPLDAAATALFLAFLAGETLADEQQWRFHQRKRAEVAAGQVPTPFLTEGLFRFSRHPNFACEQGMWWTFTLFPAAGGAAWLDPTLLGAVLLTLLFDGSTRFTESISRSKYPSYAVYQRTTSRWLPWPPRAP